MPGKARTLLIWFGRSERPVATIAAYFREISGSISGVGFARVKMMGWGAINFTASSPMLPPDTPMKSSALSKASLTPPVTLRGLVLAANACLVGERSVRSFWITPRESSTMISVAPTLVSMSTVATPAAPAPEMTIFKPASSRPSSFKELRSAARITTAVPC